MKCSASGPPAPLSRSASPIVARFFGAWLVCHVEAADNTTKTADVIRVIRESAGYRPIPASQCGMPHCDVIATAVAARSVAGRVVLMTASRLSRRLWCRAGCLRRPKHRRGTPPPPGTQPPRAGSPAVAARTLMSRTPRGSCASTSRQEEVRHPREQPTLRTRPARSKSFGNTGLACARDRAQSNRIESPD